jgi:hypothetical protein
MVRIAVILLLGLGACDVGELPGVGGVDGSISGSGCVNLSMTPPSGHHNQGMGCMSAAQCHNQALGLGVGAPAYSFGGTLFKADKTTPYAGATIVVKMGNAEKKVVTADNGNFWLVPGVAGLDPPTATTRASTTATACPTLMPMTGTLGAGDGNCAKTGCHAMGVGQGVITLSP